MGRDEDELLGSLPPVDGEDPRFADANHGVDLVDNGAFVEIEQLPDDFRNYVEVEQNPFLPGVTDNDGRPGFRPFVERSNEFSTEEGLQQSGTETEDYLNTADRDQEDAKGEDDFDVKLRHREEAAVGDDGRPVGDLLMLAGAQQAAQHEASTAAPFTNINPPSAFRALLGGSKDAPAGRGEFQVVNWVGDDSEAKPVTVAWSSLGIVGQIDPLGIIIDARPIVRIKWGTRDALHSVDIDVGNGGQLTIVASVVYVDLINADANNNNTIFRLLASVGYYTAVRTAPLILSSFVNIPAGGTVSVKRPPFASRLYSFERNNTADGYTLGFQPLATLTPPQYTYVIAGGAHLTLPIVLADNIDHVDVTNGGAGPGGSVAILMWELCL